MGEPASLDPYSPGATDLTYALVRPVYPSLFSLPPEGSPRPYLAAELTERAGSALVRLHPMRWSNGRPVTATDVAASIRRARPPSGFAGVEAHVVSKRIVRLTGPVGDWPRALATAAFVLPRGRARPAVGAGPYRIHSVTPGLEVVYRPNPRWAGPAPRIRTVRATFFEAQDIMLEVMKRRRLDAAALPATVNLGGRLRLAGLRHDSRLGAELVYLDLESSDLDPPERATIAAGVARGALDRGFTRSAGRVADTMAPQPGPNGAAGPYGSIPRDRAAPPQPVLVTTARGDELLVLVQRALQVQLARTGVETELVTIPPRTFYGRPGEVPPSVALRRGMAPPGPGDDPRSLHRFPLLQVATFVAWLPDVTGPAANPTLDGPLWNLHRWTVAR